MENSDLAVLLNLGRRLRFEGLTLRVRGFACMFPHKEKFEKFFCFHSQKRITPMDSAQKARRMRHLRLLWDISIPRNQTQKFIKFELNCSRYAHYAFHQNHLALALLPFHLQHHAIIIFLHFFNSFFYMNYRPS